MLALFVTAESWDDFALSSEWPGYPHSPPPPCLSPGTLGEFQSIYEWRESSGLKGYMIPSEERSQWDRMPHTWRTGSAGTGVGEEDGCGCEGAALAGAAGMECFWAPLWRAH